MAGRGGRGRTAKKQTDWIPFQDEVALTSLAADSETTLLDIEIENRNTGVAYGSGALVGFRSFLACNPETQLNSNPVVALMILPAGLAIPSIVTDATLKSAEMWIWARKALGYRGGPGSTTTGFYEGELVLKTARRYNQADRIVLRIMNTDENVAFAAGATGMVAGHVYARED